MYERYVELRNQKGVSDYRVAKDTGIPKSTFSDWKSGRSKPKIASITNRIESKEYELEGENDNGDS